MNNSVVEIDAQEIDRMLNNLDDAEVKNRILFDAVKSGAKVLQETTKNYFRNAMGDAATHYSPYIRKPFEEGVTMKGDKSYCEATVSIMSDHRMKWFEKGTKPRYTKGRRIIGYAKSKRNQLEREGKGHYTGSITGRNFFRNARQSSEGAITNAITQSINNALNKIMG